jgi:hypothetical protein
MGIYNTIAAVYPVSITLALYAVIKGRADRTPDRRSGAIARDGAVVSVCSAEYP